MTATGHKIMIVENQDLIRRVLYKLLSGRGYDVFAAASGEECLQVIDEFSPELVILDIYMPGGICGFDVFNALRDSAESRLTPIFFLSTLSVEFQSLSQSDSNRADQYMTIPYDRDDLLARVAAVLN